MRRWRERLEADGYSGLAEGRNWMIGAGGAALAVAADVIVSGTALAERRSETRTHLWREI